MYDVQIHMASNRWTHKATFFAATLDLIEKSGVGFMCIWYYNQFCSAKIIDL